MEVLENTDVRVQLCATRIHWRILVVCDPNTLEHISCWWRRWGCWISVGEYGCAGTVHGAYIFAVDTIKKGELVGRI